MDEDTTLSRAARALVLVAIAAINIVVWSVLITLIITIMAD